MRQAETLPSGILIEGLSGAEGDPIWIQVTRQEARLQPSYQCKASEMRADLPLKPHEDHHGRHRPTSSRATEETIRRVTKWARRACTIERIKLTQLPDRGKGKG